MITQKTVLILGAGASYPYGFPLGYELSKLILEDITIKREFEKTDFLGRPINDAKKFAESFLKAGVSSIDEFLSTREDFIEIGKYFIAKLLLPFEREDRLFDPFDYRIKDDWYKYLLQSMMTPKLEEFGSNNISFITFNYDRSLEHFLFTSLKNRFNVEDEVVSEQLNKIDFIHVHGQLGLLPWQKTKQGISIVGYGSDVNPSMLHSVRNNIKIIHEANPISQDFKDASAKIYEADKVYFLGFAYNPLSLKRLNLPERKNKTVAGTALNFGKMGIGKVVHDSNSFISELQLYPENISDFFKEHHRLQ